MRIDCELMSMKRKKSPKSKSEKGGTKNCIQNVSESILSSTRTRSAIVSLHSSRKQREEIMYGMKKVWSISFHATQANRPTQAMLLCYAQKTVREKCAEVKSEEKSLSRRGCSEVSKSNEWTSHESTPALCHPSFKFIAFSFSLPFYRLRNIRPWTKLKLFVQYKSTLCVESRRLKFDQSQSSMLSTEWKVWKKQENILIQLYKSERRLFYVAIVINSSSLHCSDECCENGNSRDLFRVFRHFHRTMVKVLIESFMDSGHFSW